MPQRLKGILLLLPFILIFFAGNIVFTIFTLVLGIIGFHDLRTAFSKKDIKFPPFIGIVLAIVLFLNSFFSIPIWGDVLIGLGFFFILVFLLLREKINIIDAALTILCLFYAFVPFWLISRIYVMADGIKYAVLIFIISFSTDIFAWIGGKKFGKHKLLPNISPKKTWEGSISGVIATFIVCLIYGYFTNINLWIMMPLSIVGSIVSQAGDLFASCIKRYCGIKDFSNLIPGHGGVMDRFDSVNFVALLMAIVLFI